MQAQSNHERDSMTKAIDAAILLLIKNGYSVTKEKHQTQNTSRTLGEEDQPNPPSEALTVGEFILRFKVGRTSAYEEIASGRLATYKVGRRRYISLKAAEDWQAKAEREQTGGAA